MAKSKTEQNSDIESKVEQVVFTLDLPAPLEAFTEEQNAAVQKRVEELLNLEVFDTIDFSVYFDDGGFLNWSNGAPFIRNANEGPVFIAEINWSDQEEEKEYMRELFLDWALKDVVWDPPVDVTYEYHDWDYPYDDSYDDDDEVEELLDEVILIEPDVTAL